MQTENQKESKFVDNLINLTQAYPRRNFQLAKDLGIAPTYLSQLLKGAKPSPILEILVEKLHKEIFSNSTKENVAITLQNKDAKELLEDFTSRLNVSPLEFIEKMLIRYGQKTFEDLERKTVSTVPSLPFQIPQWAHFHQDAIVISDRDARPLWTNKSFSDLCGYQTEELLGKRLSKLLQNEHTDKDAAESIREAVQKKKPASVWLLNQHKNGTEYFSQIEMAPVSAGGELIYFVATERKTDDGLDAQASKELRATTSRIVDFIAANSKQRIVPASIASVVTSAALKGRGQSRATDASSVPVSSPTQNEKQD